MYWAWFVAMRINDAQQHVYFILVLRENLAGSLFLGVKNNPPVRIIRHMSLDTKTHERRGYDGTNIRS